ncbi:MAG: hypothetical protein CBD32_06900 [Actinobacteria bacterium TMED172]|nr:sulfotransferase family protein [Cellvibrionales bacterium]OUW32096.1 MAG: hypothetical protein CBD32_06900 [Actinobacteria bacterium TMED172]|tara:strand:- start:14030 stop:15193 length:1164 start_codon:yes stop_codon:yes gene_type:complete
MSFYQDLPQIHHEAQQMFESCLAKKNGFNDFGGDEYQQGLEVLAKSLDAADDLNPLTAQIMRANIIDVLQSRLSSQYFLAENPSCLDTDIQRPIFIIGMPRSGTTALHRLLVADDYNQGLEYWLGVRPQPRPYEKEWSSYLDFRQCDEKLKLMQQAAPQLKDIHEMAADQADECRLLLMQSFMNVTFQSTAWVDDYEQWLLGADFTAAYQRYKINLQLISNGDSRRWVLKDPSHLWAPEALLATFPDACIVQMHRDPCELIPSVASLVYTTRQIVEPDIDKHRIGRRELAQWSGLLENLTAFRRSQLALPVYDVSMQQLQQEPATVIKNIYRHFSIDDERPNLENDIAKMLVGFKQDQQHSISGHRYTAEEFGLTNEDIEQAFAQYQ